MESLEQASKNFTIKELSCVCCGVFGIKPAFLEKAQEFRDLLNRPVIVLRGYSCPKHNAAIGGASDSRHMEGIAMDIACSNPTDRSKIVEIAMSVGFKGIAVKPTAIHLDYRISPTGLLALYPPGENRWV